MRFDKIEIPAFGPFTGFSLGLPKGKGDLHLIHGPNEAGKSSLLRALRYLLYGFPVQSPDNFRHGYQDFRIGATLSRDGERLSFFRKKGKRNTLLDAQGENLPDELLAAMLGPVDEAFFENMFGLDTAGLREGANQLLSGEGDIGAAVFSAGQGGMPINQAIRALEVEAHALYKDRSRNTTIAVLLRELRDAEQAAQVATISTRRWQVLQASIRSAEKDLTEKDEARQRHSTRCDFVSRCLQALPVMQKRNRLERELADLSLPGLPADFGSRVREAGAALASAKQALALHQRRREALRADLESIADPAPVLERSDDLDRLYRRRDAYEEAHEAIPDLKARLVTLDGLIDPEARLADFPLIDDRTLHRIKDTVTALQEAESQLARWHDELANLETRMTKSREALAALGNPDGLEALRELANRVGDFAARRNRLPDDLEELRLLENKADQFRERLGIDGSPQSLAIPPRAAIEEEEGKRRHLLEAIRDLERELGTVRSELSAEQASLDHLAGEGALYSPADLQSARNHRDAVWADILSSGEPRDELTPAIHSADEIADALRRDAGLVAAASGHRSRLKLLEAKRKDREEDLTSARQALETWTTSWENRFARKEGQLPVDLIAWREDWVELCGMDDQIEALKGRVARLREEEEALLAKLGGDEFEEGHRRLRRELEKSLEDQGNREATKSQLASEQVKRDQLLPEISAGEGELGRLREQWRDLCKVIDLDPALSGQRALREVESRVLTRSHLIERLELANEVEKKESFLREYRKTLSDCAQGLGVEASGSLLFELFEDAKERRNQRQALTVQWSRLDDDAPGLQAALEKAEADFRALQQQAHDDDLESVLVRFELRRNYREGLADQTDLLEGLARGVELEHFLAEVESCDPVALQEEATGLESMGATLQEERDRAKEALDDLRREERVLSEAGDQAAHHRQQAADLRTAIAGHYQRFRQLHHAIAFLRDQIEAWREKVQGPMMGRTSAFFRAMTGGALERVVARLDDHDVVRLLAIRASGEEVPTEGLSEGTRDQLFLALRLAAIDLHLENHPPMPLILDDLLMTFDDERVKALLPVLAELSEKTQILIFTHHDHLVDLLDGMGQAHRIPSQIN
jgi:uncharacterized protein YhaN